MKLKFIAIGIGIVGIVGAGFLILNDRSVEPISEISVNERVVEGKDGQQGQMKLIEANILEWNTFMIADGGFRVQVPPDYKKQRESGIGFLTFSIEFVIIDENTDQFVSSLQINQSNRSVQSQSDRILEYRNLDDGTVIAQTSDGIEFKKLKNIDVAGCSAVTTSRYYDGSTTDLTLECVRSFQGEIVHFVIVMKYVDQSHAARFQDDFDKVVASLELSN